MGDGGSAPKNESSYSCHDSRLIICHLEGDGAARDHFATATRPIAPSHTTLPACAKFLHPQFLAAKSFLLSRQIANERERDLRERGERERLRTKERARFSENLTDSSEENRLLLGWVAICFTDQEEDVPSVVATATTKPFAAVVDHSWHIKYL